MADDELTIRVNLQTTEAAKASEKLATDTAKNWANATRSIGFGSIGQLLSNLPILGIATGPLVKALGDVQTLASGASGIMTERAAGEVFGKTGVDFVRNMRSSYGRFSAGARGGERVEAIARALGAQGVNLEDDALRAMSEIAYAQELNAERQMRRAADVYSETSGGLRGSGGGGSAGGNLRDNAVLDWIAEAAVGGYEQVKRLINSGAASAQSR